MGEDSTEAACKYVSQESDRARTFLTLKYRLKYGKLKKIADDLGATTGQGGGKGKTTKARRGKKRKAKDEVEDDDEEGTPRAKKVDTKSEEDDGDGLI